MTFQEEAFNSFEADAWLRRNPDATTPATREDPALAALALCEIPQQGTLLDIGGAAGRVSAGFVRDHPGWRAYVVELSAEAVAAGRRSFPEVTFRQGSITKELPAAPAGAGYDIVVISGVLSWVDRTLLSHAIAHSDTALSNGGLLVICDYDGAYPRANPYAHRPGLFTYKQDYPACYLALGIYHLLHRRSFVYDSAANPADPYDRHWFSAVLRKDLARRYAPPAP